ncbi:MAG: phenylalanine--tRNA ligase subunit alpha, partial [Pseudomonadota bacterium]|nr:phenylalanine--tRNA ligase subunit alpha [Pseudomonadota bacterium]
MEELTELVHQARTALAQVDDLIGLDQTRVHYLGRKGVLTERLKQVGRLPADQRPQAGQAINAAKEQIQAAIEARKAQLLEAQLSAQLSAEAIDVTLPGRGPQPGGPHP